MAAGILTHVTPWLRNRITILRGSKPHFWPLGMAGIWVCRRLDDSTGRRGMGFSPQEAHRVWNEGGHSSIEPYGWWPDGRERWLIKTTFPDER